MPRSRNPERAFYTPVKNRPGRGFTDGYGSIYVSRADGSIRNLTRRKHCTKNRV
jgi:hypothetical protein